MMLGLLLVTCSLTGCEGCLHTKRQSHSFGTLQGFGASGPQDDRRRTRLLDTVGKSLEHLERVEDTTPSPARSWATAPHPTSRMRPLRSARAERARSSTPTTGTVCAAVAPEL
jgi:hypothetical protein